MTQHARPLTEKQKDVLDYVSNFFSTKGYSPSLKEIASYLKTSNLSTAQYYVDELVTKKYLKKIANKDRGLIPLIQKVSIPLLGYIAAGEPIEPIENPEQIGVPSSIKMNPSYPHYALAVRGDSMVDMGVLNGDIILIKHQMTARNGDVIVAITEKGATLKVYREDKEGPILEPRSSHHSTIYPKQLEVRGKFIGLIRRGFNE